MKKSFFSILLALSMLCAFIPITASAGSYGGYLTYEYSSNWQEITITNCNSSATEVVIPNEIDGLPVTTIADNTFRYCYSMTSITIPESVTSIGKGGFGSCESITVDENNKYYSASDGVLYNKDKTILIQYLNGYSRTSFTVPDGVTMIGEEAFYLSSLTSVTIPDSVTHINDNAFRCCYDLTDVTIGKGAMLNGTAAFGECTALKTIAIDENNEYITVDDGVIYNKDKTTLIQYLSGNKRSSFTIPDGVMTIYAGAFYNCTDFTNSITIPNSVLFIDNDAFYDCSNVRTINIGSGVEHIGDNAFYGCSALNNVTIPNGVTYIGDNAFYRCHTMDSVTIPDSVETIGDSAFYRTGLKEITISDNVKSIGFGAFEDTIYYNNSDNWEDEVLYIGNHLIQAKYGGASDAIIKNGTKVIADKAFYKRTDLTSVTIPDSVTMIGESAFSDCSELTSVIIGDGVKKICDGAFNYCRQLTSVVMGNSVENIGDKAFFNCDKLTDITIPDGVINIGISAFTYTALTNVTIPDSVKIIGETAFDGCHKLTSVTLGRKLGDIGAYAFRGTGITSVYMYKSIDNIVGDVFYECYDLKNITVEEGSDRYSSVDGVLYNKNKTQLIKYPVGNERTEFTIPDGVTLIDGSAFAGCDSLKNIVIPNGVNMIRGKAFENCTALTDITISNGVTWIPSNTFDGCTALKSVTIPNGVTEIGEEAFYNCFALTDVYFMGTEKEWNSINIKKYNDALGKATIHYNCTPVTTAEITKSTTETEYTFDVNAKDKYKNCYVYAAVYDENGVLIEVNCVPMNTAENTNISVDKNDSGKTVKVFLWTDGLQSIIEKAKEFEI